MGSRGRVEVIRVTVSPIKRKHILKPNLKEYNQLAFFKNVTIYGSPPIIVKAPANPTEAIENVEEDCNFCIVMVVIDEGEPESLAVVSHQSVCQGNAEEAKPYLGNTELKSFFSQI